jgi:hypothetical protein
MIGVLRHLAVSGNVVAGHDGEGGDAACLALLKAGKDQAEDGLRARRVLPIFGDCRMGRIERTRCIDEIAAFGDRHRNDADFRVGQRLHQGRDVAGGDDVDHRRGDAGGGPVVVLLDDGGQEILGLQLVAHGAVGRHHAGADDCPVMRLAGVEQVVEIDRLVGAVEIADAEMHDAGSQALGVIGRHRGRGRSVLQARQRKLHSHCLYSDMARQAFRARPLSSNRWSLASSGVM